MVNHSKANALNRRTNDAVGDLAYWIKYLRTELAKQLPLERPVGASTYSEGQYPETMSANGALRFANPPYMLTSPRDRSLAAAYRPSLLPIEWGGASAAPLV